MILVKTFLSVNKTGVHQKITKGNLNGHIHAQGLLTRPVLRCCLLASYVPLPVSGNASVPVHECARLGFLYYASDCTPSTTVNLRID